MDNISFNLELQHLNEMGFSKELNWEKISCTEISLQYGVTWLKQNISRIPLGY